MNKKEFKSFCHEEFIKHGFIKHRSTYYANSNQGFLCSLMLQSSYSSGYYINCHIFLGNFSDPQTYPSRYDFDLYDRPICVQSKVTFKGEYFMTALIEYEKYSADELRPYFDKAFTEKILPPLEKGKEELIKNLDVWDFPHPTVKSEKDVLEKLKE